MSDADRDDPVPPMSERLLRGLFMLLFALVYNIAEIVLIAVAVVQFIFMVVTSADNARLREFGASVSAYVYQIFLFLTYNTETRPWPFSDWPPPPPGSITRRDEID